MVQEALPPWEHSVLFHFCVLCLQGPPAKCLPLSFLAEVRPCSSETLPNPGVLLLSSQCTGHLPPSWWLWLCVHP